MTKPYINISNKALGEIKNIMTNKNIPEGYGLRIGVRGAGCAGVRQYLGFDKIKEKDDNFNINGVEVYVEKKDALYLIGLELDFQDDADARGFVFKSKN